jgi:hypothetical protein
VKLKDLLGFEQEEAAKKWVISSAMIVILNGIIRKIKNHRNQNCAEWINIQNIYILWINIRNMQFDLKKYILIFAFFFLFNINSVLALDGKVCVVYFTGEGCPNCAVTDPYIFKELVPKYNGNFVVIEYEIYKNTENKNVVAEYSSTYKTMSAVPLVIFGENDTSIGRYDVLEIGKKIDSYLEKGGNPCPLINGSAMDFSDLDLKSLPGKPVIWPKQQKNETNQKGSCSLGAKRCVKNVYYWSLEECDSQGKWNVLKMCEYGCNENDCNPEPASAKNVWILLLLILIIILIAVFLHWRVSK